MALQQKTDIKELIKRKRMSMNDYKISDEIMEYLRKYGKEIDSSTVAWIINEAKGGCPIAQNNLGTMYGNSYSVPKDYQKAFEWIKKSADNGYSYGILSLGIIYDFGYGVPQDYIKALECYQKSVDQGNPHAMVNLGGMYQTGKGVTQDYKKTFELFKKSADHGIAHSLYNVGLMYEYGKGIDVNISMALKYYMMSMKHGFEKAPTKLHDIITLHPEIIISILFEDTDKLMDLEKELKETKARVEKLETRVEELEISAPIEGGPLYKKAMEHFNDSKQRLKQHKINHETNGLD
jgi:TPR repeat protein